MGRATTLIGVSVFISIISLLVAISIYSFDPTNPMLASNALLGQSNLVYSSLDGGSNPDNWTYSKDYTSTDNLPIRETTGDVSTTSTNFPDWTYSSLEWIKSVGSVLLNSIGAPYTLAMMIAPTSPASAVVGAGLAIFNLFIIVGWILGKID